MKTTIFALPAFLLVFATDGFTQQKKTVADHLEELPSLGITKDDALRNLDAFKDLKQRDSLTPGIENWWACCKEQDQQLVYSLKCVKEKIVAVSIEVPGIVPAEQTTLLVSRTAFAIRALANADKAGEWDRPEQSGRIGQLIAQATRPPFRPVGGRSKSNLVVFVYHPARNAVQISVWPLGLMEYDIDGGL